jgi:hypothetical protein
VIFIKKNNKTKTKNNQKMKTKFGLITAFAFSISILMAQIGMAQCDTKTIRKNINYNLDEYVYESFAYKQYDEFENKKNIKAVFEVYTNRKYRLIDVSEGLQINPVINIYDSKNKLIISNNHYKKNKIFDFKTKKSETYIIEYIINNEDVKNPKNKCIAFGLGYE